MFKSFLAMVLYCVMNIAMGAGVSLVCPDVSKITVENNGAMQFSERNPFSINHSTVQ